MEEGDERERAREGGIGRERGGRKTWMKRRGI
jgi:hypothetical protein